MKHLTVVPLAGKLSAPRQTHCMTEVTVSMSRKVLTEASLDASILSSVVGSYDDHNISGSASFMQQGSSSNHSDSSFHASNLFNTLLHLMEPSYVRYCVCMYLCMYVYISGLKGYCLKSTIRYICQEDSRYLNSKFAISFSPSMYVCTYIVYIYMSVCVCIYVICMLSVYNVNRNSMKRRQL